MDHIGGALHLTAGALASAFLGLSVLKLQAETAMRFKIPFDFYVGEMKLPAGAYTLEHADSLLRVQDQSGHGATVLTNGAILPAAIEQPELVFHRYATHYFLSEVKWTESILRVLPPSAIETEIVRTRIAQRVYTTNH